MSIDADLTRAVDRLRVASINHARARGKLDRTELERARAIADARAVGMTSREIGAVLGISHVHVLHLARGVAGDTRPDPSATACAHAMLPDEDRCARCGMTGQAIHAGQRGAPQPTPVGVLLARAPEVTASEPDPSATGDYTCIAEDNAAARGICAAADKRDRATELCRRVGCQEPALAGRRFCEVHSRY